VERIEGQPNTFQCDLLKAQSASPSSESSSKFGHHTLKYSTEIPLPIWFQATRKQHPTDPNVQDVSILIKTSPSLIRPLVNAALLLSFKQTEAAITPLAVSPKARCQWNNTTKQLLWRVGHISSTSQAPAVPVQDADDSHETAVRLRAMFRGLREDIGCLVKLTCNGGLLSCYGEEGGIQPMRMECTVVTEDAHEEVPSVSSNYVSVVQFSF
jgi:hypothetical protein